MISARDRDVAAPPRKPVTPLTDGIGRRFEYLRLSLTDACNFRLRSMLAPFAHSTRGRVE